MSFDFSVLLPIGQQLLKSSLPTIGGILSDAVPFPANLLVNSVFKAIAAKYNVNPDLPTAPEQVAAAVKADPDPGKTLASVEDEHKNILDAAQAELDSRLHDTQDARQAEVEYVKSGSKIQWAPAIISTINVIGFYGIIAAVFLFTGDLTVNQAALLNILIGAAIGAYLTTNNFWLGSSVSSKTKDEALIGLAKTPQIIQGPGSHVSGGVKKVAK